MIIMLAAAAAMMAAPVTAIDAERAFARDAQRIGQWASFRKWSARDAVMFTPQAVWARDFLRGRKEPARAVSWSPAASITSCDGTVAVNGGPSAFPDGRRGRFTTVWLKDKGRWKWIYDSGEDSRDAVPVVAVPVVSQASCAGRPQGAPIAPPPPVPSPTRRGSPNDYGRGQSADRTLGWNWKVEKDGTRTFRAYQWDGERYVERVHQRVAP